MTTSIVVGCGFTGSKLAQLLVKKGHEVYGITKSGVSIEGVNSLKRDVTNSNISLPECDFLFYLVSASYKDLESYKRIFINGLKNILDSSTGKLIYSSSTGVYERGDGKWVDEKTDIDPESERAEILKQAEDIALNEGKVVRLAGLYGPGRYGFDRYLERRVRSGYVNLIHRNDAASALKHAALEGENDLYLAVDDEPVHSHNLAKWLAKQMGKKNINLSDEKKKSSKRCSNSRLRSEGWNPEYPNFREGYKEAIN